MYKVLLPVDDNTDRAAAQARYVLELPGNADDLSVTIAHAYQDGATGAGSFDEESPGVIEATDILAAADITTEQRELYLPVAGSILEMADDIGVNEVVLCGQKRSPAGKALFGSVTQSVALESSVPVAIVPVE
jgi:nucleotide-binding universal stress UspA family protein